ncbi:MAG: hypothetical protein ACHQTE_02815 [Candidatus Saccharimonadales bacterium]
MYPDQNQYSIDYLNQIAPVQKKPGLANKFTLIIIIAAVLIVATIGLIALASSSAGPTNDMQTLAARLQNLQTVADGAQKNLKSSALRSTNSNLSLFLTNTNRDIVTPLGNNHVNVTKLDASVVKAEKNDTLASTLEDARLNAVFDDTYAREMTYQLATISALMTKIYTSTKSNSLKTFLVNTDKNLQPIKKQFTAFTTPTDALAG